MTKLQEKLKDVLQKNFTAQELNALYDEAEDFGYFIKVLNYIPAITEPTSDKEQP